MVTCEERRRVAERLREHSDARLFTGDDVERLIGIELSGFRPKDADNSYNRLADLIEPPACPARAVRSYAEEVDWHTGESPLVHELRGIADRMDRECAPVDREALLALADEMDAEKNFVLVGGYARRIREALGVEDG